MTTPTTKRNPWSWIPTLYFAEGLPYVAVMTIAVIMYKRLGLSNTEIALYTSWLYLPWTIKPLWSPFVDLVKTKRSWIIAMQGFIAAGFAGIAFFIPTAHYVQFTLAFFWLLAFSSATHDIAAALGQMKQKNQRIVAFALETNDEESNAQKKRVKKNADFIVLNSTRNPGTTFRTDDNQITIISEKGKKEYEKKPKTEVAHDIIDELALLF